MGPIVLRRCDGDAQPLILQFGRNCVGRLPENDAIVDDDTVSGVHCEIEVAPEIVRVRDLGSTNGTFIDGRLIQEGMLGVGQRLRVGTVEFIREQGADLVDAPRSRVALAKTVRAAEPVAAGAVEPAAETAGDRACRNHGQVRADYFCVACGGLWCRRCVKWLPTAGRQAATCVACGGLCVEAEQHRHRQAIRSATFFRLLPDAFAYPFRKNGLTLLIGGTIFFGLLDFLMGSITVLRTPSVGVLVITLLVAVISTGYLYAFMQGVIQASARGDAEMPAWPEVSSFVEDLVMPAARLVAIVLVLCGPGWVLLAFGQEIVGGVVLWLGLSLMPMCLLTTAMADTLAALNPVAIVWGIAKVPVAYFVTCVLFLASVAAYAVLGPALESTGIPIAPTFVGTFCFLYLVTLTMRVLGILYLTNRERLGWF